MECELIQIVDLGESNGYFAQTTSVPGVAQRTGATIYYVELYPRARALADGGEPVLALMPLPLSYGHATTPCSRRQGAGWSL